MDNAGPRRIVYFCTIETDNDSLPMKLKPIFLRLFLAVLPITAAAQPLSLADCRRMARANYPLARSYGLVDLARDYDLSNAARAWLPGVGVSTGAFAFTDVLDSSQQMKAMGIDTKNTAAGASLTVTQKVYDGGNIAAAKAVSEADAAVSRRELDVQFYEVEERVDELFFALLLFDEQTAQNRLLQRDVATALATVESMLAGGTATEADRDALRVEQVRALQQADALAAARRAYSAMLARFIGKDGDEDLAVTVPSAPSYINGAEVGAQRPEMSLFAARDGLLEAQRCRLDAALRPTVGLTGFGTYHTQVSDLLHRGMLAAGLTLTWNVGALYTRRNDLRRLDTAREQNDVARTTFLFNVGQRDAQTAGNIETLERRIARDAEIVSLQESLQATAGRRVRLGTESVNEWVRRINATEMARSDKALHELQLLREQHRRSHNRGE